jgi:hypothetical protein
MRKMKKLYQNILDMSLKRLKHEDKDKDERLSKKGDPYY